MATAQAAAPPHLRLSASEKNVVEALAGAFGACVSTWLFYPLDTLKTRLQAREAAFCCVWAAFAPGSGAALTAPRARRAQAAVPGANGAPPEEGDSLLSVWRHLVRAGSRLPPATEPSR